ncbi:M23 family metallopeptidase [Streptomyces sannanensis]|uniref:M23 family metallopeptidase n=1 Tax=Streptomyces sannanensis TaxID=285536 RepID=UPI003CD05FFF
MTTAYRKRGPHWSLGYHTGADYAAQEGRPCIAARSGSIARTGIDVSFGKFLVLRADGFDYWYCHLSARHVTSGSVRAGQKIGKVGSTGNAGSLHDRDLSGFVTRDRGLVGAGGSRGRCGGGRRRCWSGRPGGRR